MVVGAEPKYSPSKVMQIIKSITARQLFNNTLKSKNSFGVWTVEWWRHIGTIGDGTTSDVIKNYVENQGNREEKEAYQQMKILDF